MIYILSNTVDIILAPIKYLFSLLTHEVFFDALGVTPLGIAVTCICVAIVLKALLNPVNISSFAHYRADKTGARPSTSTAVVPKDGGN